MSVSSYRTIILPLNPTAYDEYLIYPPLRWPVAEPDDNLDYSLSIALELADVADTVVSFSVSISPDDGALVAGNLAVEGSLLTVWLAGGIPGRDYRIKIEVGTLATRAYEWLVQLLIDPTLGTYPPPAYPAPGFSPPVVWLSFALDFSEDGNSQYLALI